MSEKSSDFLQDSSTRIKQGGTKRKHESSSRTEQTIPSSNEVDEFVPTRQTENTYACSETVNCALTQHCVPCAYKVCCFDVALDTEVRRKIPNQRPEQCPRLIPKQNTQPSPRRGTPVLGYRPGMSILTVGDGDFSFSLAIARLLSRGEKRKHPSRIVATSYESRETLTKIYPDFNETLSELKALSVIVCFQVDATRLNETLPSSILKEIDEMNHKFHRIIWNFPCTAEEFGKDGQNSEMERNKGLVASFVANIHEQEMLHQHGEIHMCHKTKPPFNQWKIEEAALQACQSAVYLGRIVLDRSLIPPYTPRKALDRKSFPCHDACIYVLKFKEEAQMNGYPFPNTISTTMTNAIDLQIASSKTKKDNSEDPILLVPVTKELIVNIRTELLAAAITAKRQTFTKLRKGNNASHKGNNKRKR